MRIIRARLAPRDIFPSRIRSSPHVLNDDFPGRPRRSVLSGTVMSRNAADFLHHAPQIALIFPNAHHHMRTVPLCDQ